MGRGKRSKSFIIDGILVFLALVTGIPVNHRYSKETVLFCQQAQSFGKSFTYYSNLLDCPAPSLDLGSIPSRIVVKMLHRLGRWFNYTASERGGNRLLEHRDPRNFRFSILQRVSPDMEADHVIRIESLWKQRLHTRKPYGLNGN